MAETDLYLNRRRMAAAAWATVPLERFDLSYWKCGSKACALGWLAEKEIDGWSWSIHCGHATPMGPDGRTGFRGAAGYFGITPQAAYDTFAPDGSERTPSSVGDTLLALPI